MTKGPTSPVVGAVGPFAVIPTIDTVIPAIDTVGPRIGRRTEDRPSDR
ncbi:hypothetical protein [Arsenicicoccus sp. UBA7492]|nr:hypothetical protein [Arsenicicoccus sp. UBA7492]